jgi:hypothetical protein
MTRVRPARAYGAIPLTDLEHFPIDFTHSLRA